MLSPWVERRFSITETRKKFASHFIWLPVFLCLTLISPALECVGQGRFIPAALLPAIGSMAMVYALYQRNPKITKYIALFSQTMWLAYCIYTNNISGTPAVCLSYEVA